MNNKRIFVVGASLLTSVCFSLSSPVIAGPIVPQVDLIHKFDTRIMGNQVYRGAWDRYDRAIAQDTGGTKVDTFGPASNAFAPPAAGTTAPKALAKSPKGGAKADMISSFAANANGTGFTRVRGKARILNNTGILATSEGYSTVALNRGVTDRNGNIRWSPEWKFHTARTGRIGDPIFIEYLDLDDGSLLSSTLFDLDLDVSDGGDSTYHNGDLFISGAEGSFTLFMDSPYITSGTGSIEIHFSGGLITSAVSSGIFSSLLLPSVDSSSMGFGFHLGDDTGAFDISWDFGAEPEGENILGYEFHGRFGGDALIEADEVQPIPEPAALSLVGLGLISLSRMRRKG
jgi:hypothetical protein